jgi:hypothetical protein
MDPTNLLALLQAAQQAQRSPTALGPISPQQLQPGFRAPPLMGMNVPQPQQQPGFDPSQMSGMLGGLAGMRHSAGWVPSSSGSEPSRTAGDADLGGYGAGIDPMSGNPNAQPTIFNSQDPHEQAIQQALNQAMPTTQSGGGLFSGLGNWISGLF